MAEDRHVLIYDGDCKLCENTVRFLRSKNNAGGLEFIPASDAESDQLLTDYRIPKETTARTVILIDKNKVFTKSEAVIRALQKRGGIWRLAGIFMVIPAFIRNLTYDWVAGIRKKL